MFRRNLLFALAFVAAIFWFSQGAYAEPPWEGDWGGFWGSNNVVGTCSGKGTAQVSGNLAEVNWDGTCTFSQPSFPTIKPKGFKVPCHVGITYTFKEPPQFTQLKGGGFEQSWFAACSDMTGSNPKLQQVTGLLHCPAQQGKNGESPEINDPLGVTVDTCNQAFGNDPLLDLVFQFEGDFDQSRLKDLSLETKWNSCHADVVNDVAALARCTEIINKKTDIQRVLTTGTNPVTRAYCEYNPGDTQPINSTCGGDAGNVTMTLFADKPAGADEGIISTSLDSVDLGSFLVNGFPPKKDGQCKLNDGKDAIQCKFPTCAGQKGPFIFSSGIAHLTAERTSGTGIQCINQLEIK